MAHPLTNWEVYACADLITGEEFFGGLSVKKQITSERIVLSHNFV